MFNTIVVGENPKLTKFKEQLQHFIDKEPSTTTITSKLSTSIPQTRRDMLHVAESLRNEIDSINNQHNKWISRPNSYESEFCSEVGWELETKGAGNGPDISRWVDATYGNVHIELKKSQDAQWYDLIRYGQIARGTHVTDVGTPLKHTLTVVIHYGKLKKFPHVKHFYIIDTRAIISHLNLSEPILNAVELLYTTYNVQGKRGLNLLKSISIGDTADMAGVVVTSTTEQVDSFYKSFRHLHAFINKLNNNELNDVVHGLHQETMTAFYDELLTDDNKRTPKVILKMTVQYLLFRTYLQSIDGQTRLFRKLSNVFVKEFLTQYNSNFSEFSNEFILDDFRQ